MPTTSSRSRVVTPPSPTTHTSLTSIAKPTSTEGITSDLANQGQKYIGSLSSTSFTIVIVIILIGILAICFIFWFFTVGKARRQKKKNLQQFTIQNSDGSSSTTVVKPGV
ncbi:hypothetical protein I302_108018 [Kwoniella bestiolae CBS 10118]|uniref:Uncharacterized protein n=1 Tax=Kwoniella bestiolae CBS 10118 TaxID=1296100 RepID=A0A1B9FWX0_9TREE|nr:hypothetical protein I302_07616 [Kwoniella bestiolae CBS 10118]OCF23262.1 hypothetical protein I302_07616 [Kwoniella bestiolae CBS 10118]